MAIVTHSSAYRPDIDGLRAVAVLSVIGFHAFPEYVHGGFVGVDVFFVISGFLITGIIVRELALGDFSFSRFYARRIRRIFPALIIVLGATFILGWLLLLPNDFISLGRNIAGGAGSAANIVLYQESGYFDVAADHKPLLHLWSLGIEEQFYIVWPMTLFIAFRRKMNPIPLIGLICVVSFVFNVVFVRDHPTATFYLPHSRAWELLLGGLLACVYARRYQLPFKQTIARRFSERVLPDAAALCGLLFISIAILKLNSHSRFPGWWALLPTVGTFLIIAAERSWINRKLLANPMLVFIGLVSYPLYLWHWPLLAFLRITEIDKSDFAMRSLIVAISFALAAATYKIVERPLRYGTRGRAKTEALTIVMVLVACVGVVTVKASGFDFRIPEEARDLTKANFDVGKEWRLNTCFLESSWTSVSFKEDCVDREPRPLVFLWGDSNAASLYPGLRAVQGKYQFGIAQLTNAGCPPLLDYTDAQRPTCEDNNKFIFSLIAKNMPEIVLLDAAWNNGSDMDLSKFAITIGKLKTLGIKRIVLIGPPVNWGRKLPQFILNRYRRDPSGSVLPERSEILTLRQAPALDRTFAEAAKDWGIEYFSVWHAICTYAGCLMRVGPTGRDIIAFDEVHLTLSGSKYLANVIMSHVFDRPNERSANSLGRAANSASPRHNLD